MNKKHNKTFNLNNIQKQIIYSGTLGDGNIRVSGYGAIYREKHSLKEKEYCLWKNENLKDLTKDKKIYQYKEIYISFDTYNCKEILEIYLKDKKEIIKELDELGLILYLFDDGWVRHYKKHSSFVVESKKISLENMIELKNKFEKIFETEVTLNTRKCKKTNKDIITLNVKKINKLIDICKKFKLNELDIYKKKIKI